MTLVDDIGLVTGLLVVVVVVVVVVAAGVVVYAVALLRLVNLTVVDVVGTVVKTATT